MTDTDTLAEVFEDEPETEETPSTEPEVTGEQPSTEEPASTPEAQDTEPGSVLIPQAALLDERGKRQHLEKEVERLRSMMPEQQPPDMYEDPQGYEQFIRNQERDRMQQQQQQQYMARLETSRSGMLEKHADFPQMEQLFLVIASNNPGLVSSMQNSADPAAFAYEAAKAYRDEALQRAQGTPEQTQPEPVKQRPNLATATAQATTGIQAEKDETLEEMFADQSY